MHAAERENLIIEWLENQGFVSFKEFEKRLPASSATIRRDLERLAASGSLIRVRGGAKRRATVIGEAGRGRSVSLSGAAFRENIGLHLPAKRAIGEAAAKLCSVGESVMIDGGSTTLQMCPFLADLRLQVFSNSLHIVSALLPQSLTRIVVPSGQIFREQNIILSVTGSTDLPLLHAPKLFMGAAAIGAGGLMQADGLLVAAERQLIDRAEQTIVLVDSSKFQGPSGQVVCSLDEIDVIVTDAGIMPEHKELLEGAGIRLVIAGL